MMRRDFAATTAVSLLLLLLAGAAGSERECAARARVGHSHSAPVAAHAKGTGAHSAAVPPTAAPASAAAGAGAGLAVSAAARGIGASSIAAPIAPAAASPGGTGANPVAAAVTAPLYTYKSAGKSDPFRPFIETDPTVKKKTEEETKKRPDLKIRPVSPLQQADIERFRLVGIAGDEKSRMAIVEDSVAKKFYPLSVGTFIGQNGGRVTAILADRVIVTERIVTEARKEQSRRITVMLHKEEEGKP